MDVVPYAGRLVGWVRSIGVLAASADLQRAWLDSIGLVASWNVDELGLEFDDGWILMEQWREVGCIAEISVGPLHALNAALDDMSGESNAALWTRDALANHRQWRVVRSLAMDVLCTFP